MIDVSCTCRAHDDVCGDALFIMHEDFCPFDVCYIHLYHIVIVNLWMTSHMALVVKGLMLSLYLLEGCQWNGNGKHVSLYAECRVYDDGLELFKYHRELSGLPSKKIYKLHVKCRMRQSTKPHSIILFVNMSQKWLNMAHILTSWTLPFPFIRVALIRGRLFTFSLTFERLPSSLLSPFDLLFPASPKVKPLAHTWCVTP